jgi:flavin-dependent dehydrogenase
LGETIPPAAVFILEEVSGRKIDLATDGHLPWLGRRSSWASTDIHDHSSIFDVQGHGWRINRDRFEELLISLATEQGAVVLDQWKLVARELVRCSTGWQVGLIDAGGVQRELATEIFVDATGQGAHAVRRVHGSGRRQNFDRLMALSIDFPQREINDPADATSIVEAVDSGYWYSVLDPDKKRLFTYFTDLDSLTYREMRNTEFFTSALGKSKHVGSLLDGCSRDNGGAVTVRVRPAMSSRRPSVAGDGWYAIGDAAMTFDPICSQGIYTAMRLGLEAARAISAGSRGDGVDYQAFTDRAWQGYLDNLNECYGFVDPERFGPSASFWGRRQPRRIARW